jgi:hypothetical protein
LAFVAQYDSLMRLGLPAQSLLAVLRAIFGTIRGVVDRQPDPAVEISIANAKIERDAGGCSRPARGMRARPGTCATPHR